MVSGVNLSYPLTKPLWLRDGRRIFYHVSCRGLLLKGGAEQPLKIRGRLPCCVSVLLICAVQAFLHHFLVPSVGQYIVGTESSIVRWVRLDNVAKFTFLLKRKTTNGIAAELSAFFPCILSYRISLSMQFVAKISRFNSQSSICSIELRLYQTSNMATPILAVGKVNIEVSHRYSWLVYDDIQSQLCSLLVLYGLDFEGKGT